jgi:hypothetical protein
MTALPLFKYWHAVVAPVGHFKVLRALPVAQRRSIGPFVFLDHFGPFKASPETLPAHPHAGIEVMTYLIEGANEHRDSMGNIGVVQAGGAQWMRAGRGVLHAETNLPELAPTIHGLQIWARLSIANQSSEPAYRAIHASDVPTWQDGAATLKLLAGRMAYGDFDFMGPMPMDITPILLHVRLPPLATWNVPALDRTFELGVYGIGGETLCEVASVEAQSSAALMKGSMVLLPQRGEDAHAILLRNTSRSEDADVLLLGGLAAPKPLFFGGPFVLASQAALMQAQEDFFSGKMGTLDGVPFAADD